MSPIQDPHWSVRWAINHWCEMSYLSRASYVRHQAKRLVEKSLRLRMYFAARRPHGLSCGDDIKRVGHEVRLILDVGANVGQSEFLFRESFPNAEIHCFEPVRSSFETLVSNVCKQRTHCHRVAIGSTSGPATIYHTGQSLTNSLIEPKCCIGSEIVETTTLDEFADANSLGHIDLLKIDTEGFDLEVLRGAANLLRTGRVSFVSVEVGFHPEDRRHVLLDDVRELLLRDGFSVFGFYDQTLEWSGESRLRFANAVFSRPQST